MAELAEGSGHWIWSRDEGFAEYVEFHMGKVMQTMDTLSDYFSSPPEHWWKDLGDKNISVKIVNKITGESGFVDQYKVDGEKQTGKVEIPGYSDMQGAVIHIFEGKDNKDFVTYAEGDFVNPKTQVKEWHRVKVTRSIVDGEFHLLLEHLEPEDWKSSGKRIFKRFPYYKIVNNTGRAVKLNTYGEGDFACLFAALSVEFPAGTTYQDAYDPNTTGEQAYFTLGDGRQYSTTVKAFDTVELNDSMFE